MNRLGATLLLKNAIRISPKGIVCREASVASQQPSLGSGVGMGGGAGGSVRELGGAFGLREAAEEEFYFRRLTEQQLQQIHDLHVEEIKYLEKEMKEHAEAIARQKQKLRALKLLGQGEGSANYPPSVRVD